MLITVAVSAVSAPPSTATSVLVGAGDIARCSSESDEATAALLAGIKGTVFTLGDNAYPDGSLRRFTECYDPGWGTYLARTRPSPGNHDYATPGAGGYFEYFRWRAGPGDRGYYAFDRGNWRIYSLNSEDLSEAQLDWLQADLASNRVRCSLAYWHRPRFSSGQHGNQPDVAPLWTVLYAGGVDVVLNGHDHDYERFYPQRPNGSRYWRGVRQFVVGTGGATPRAFATVQPNSAARVASEHGVLKLVLKDQEYRWRFITVDGDAADTGSARCYGRRGAGSG